MAKIEIYSCDICKKETKINKKKIQVIFTTDQTEGRSCEPYLSDEVIEICNSCFAHVLLGNYLWASGAQGHNQYYFK